jgi:hypothetical protein
MERKRGREEGATGGRVKRRTRLTFVSLLAAPEPPSQ